VSKELLKFRCRCLAFAAHEVGLPMAQMTHLAAQATLCTLEVFQHDDVGFQLLLLVKEIAPVGGGDRVT
jgi:hypothetical protein